MRQPDKMKNLIDYFSQVRIRPAMYLGTNTITRLYDHLQGYRIAFWFNDIDNPVDKNFFDNFNEFVYNYYGIISSDNWKGVILEQSFGSEEKALDTFFELFDLFIAKFSPINTKQLVLAFYKKLVFEQREMKSKLGSQFESILSDTFELINECALSNLKYDYDFILEELIEKGKESKEVQSALREIGVPQE